MRAIIYPDKFSNFYSEKCFSTNERRTEDENAINYGIANTQKKKHLYARKICMR